VSHSVILQKVPTRSKSTPRDLPVPRASQMSRLRAHQRRTRQRRSVGMRTQILGVFHEQSGESDPDLTLLPIHRPCISIFNSVLSYLGLSFMKWTTSSNWGYTNKGMLRYCGHSNTRVPVLPGCHLNLSLAVVRSAVILSHHSVVASPFHPGSSGDRTSSNSTDGGGSGSMGGGGGENRNSQTYSTGSSFGHRYKHSGL
jgi:hypothetical protein